MTTLITVLRQRTERLKKLTVYFTRLNVTQASKENFPRVIIEGETVIALVQSAIKINEVMISRIENYLVACEESIVAVGIELTSEYCEILEILDDFRDERLLLMKFLSGELNDSMFC